LFPGKADSGLTRVTTPVGATINDMLLCSSADPFLVSFDLFFVVLNAYNLLFLLMMEEENPFTSIGKLV
jgi:hypothetical protein